LLALVPTTLAHCRQPGRLSRFQPSHAMLPNRRALQARGGFSHDARVLHCAAGGEGVAANPAKTGGVCGGRMGDRVLSSDLYSVLHCISLSKVCCKYGVYYF
jgi:hypothetical protein